MIQAFEKFISENNLLTKKQKILVAVSGGIDSIVLCDLLLKTGYKISIAHCNFQLRGKESNADEKFVKAYSEKNSLDFFSKKFNTKDHAKAFKISTQMAARELRYQWFDELTGLYKYDVLVTAHHQTDVLETMLINQIRGTGISGLHGIRAKQHKVIRPLLFASRQMIEQYAKSMKIKWREDSSNKATDYTRNLIRHKIIPVLKSINPSVEASFYGNAIRFYETELLLNSFISFFKKELLFERKNKTYIQLEKLNAFEGKNELLFLLLKDFGFKNELIREINLSLEKEPGKRFLSTTHELIKDRRQLIISTINKENVSQAIIINDKEKTVSANGFELLFSKIKNTTKFIPSSDPHIGCFDTDAIKFPLTLRQWKAGDFFYPLGMNGKRKKLSDFLTDKKIPLSEKDDCMVLTSEDKIIWVVNHRIDERFKITSATKNIVKCEYISNY